MQKTGKVLVLSRFFANGVPSAETCAFAAVTGSYRI